MTAAKKQKNETAMNATPLKKVGRIFIGLIGLAACAMAVSMVLETETFRQSASRAEGKVTAIERAYTHPGLLVAFTTAKGERLSYRQNGMIWGYKPGDAVSVLYDPAYARSTAVIDAPGTLWPMPAMFGFIGIVLIAGCALNLPVRAGWGLI